MPRFGNRMISRRAVLAAIPGLVALAACGRSGSSSEAIPSPALAPAYPRDDLFVSPDWLADRIDEPKLRVLDLSPLPRYREGHLPNARHIWWQDTIELHNPAYGMLVNDAGRQELVRKAGITEETDVVCYDADGGIYAARMIWMLRYMGFQGARMLVGGTPGWETAGYSLTREQPDPPTGGISDVRDESIVAHAQDILARLEEPNLVILDTRTESERTETWDDRLLEGIIPGSYWLPRDRFLTPGPVPALIDADALRERLSQAGVTVDQTAEIIVYGLHGTLACLPYLALFGLDRFHVRLYDGSWSEWGMNPDRPMAPISS